MTRDHRRFAASAHLFASASDDFVVAAEAKSAQTGVFPSCARTIVSPPADFPINVGDLSDRRGDFVRGCGQINDPRRVLSLPIRKIIVLAPD